jgi:uncharacterized DUF497 family protein
MRFAWDRAKAESNVRKHKVAFEEAVSVFYNPLAVTFPDPDHSDGEIRLLTFGYSRHDRLLVVAHTESEDVVRIISARVATPREKKRYEAKIPTASR